jgi:transposase
LKHQKIVLQELFNNRLSDAKTLSQMSGVPIRTVFRDLKKMRQGVSLKRKVGSGRPEILKSNDKRRLIQCAIKGDLQSSDDLRIKLSNAGSPQVSSRTVRRYLNKAGYKSMEPKFRPLLTSIHKDKRVKWCQDHKKTRWNNWIFSDESRFQLYTNKIGRWAKKRPTIGKPKFGPAVMVWGAISNKGTSDLQIIHGIINSEKYIKTLTAADKKIRLLKGNNFMFVQDGATCHTSRVTMTWLKDSNWNVSSWPANSPDLNPIENVWGVMKKAVERRRPKNILDLEKILKEIWANLTLDYLKSLFNSMTDRINKCIDVNGDITGY